MSLQNLLLSNELLGWAAALLTLLTFVCRDMRRLRLLALAANAAFIAYGALAQLTPVLALHLALVPVNLWRLNQTLRPATRRDDAAAPATLSEPSPHPGGRPRRGWTPARRRGVGTWPTASKLLDVAADREGSRSTLRLIEQTPTASRALADDRVRPAAAPRVAAAGGLGIRGATCT